MKIINPSKFRGQATLEFALVFPLILLLILFTFDLGRVIFYQSVIHNAAREGARFGSVDPDYTRTYDIVVDYTFLLDQSQLVIDPVFVPNPCNILDCTVSVNITYDVKPITPILPIFLTDSEIHLNATSTMRLEP